MTMRRLINLKRVEARRIYLTYAIVIIAYVICQVMSSTKFLSSSMRGMLVPICAYMVMAVSLNLVVGILGELSLGHAGFMSVGAFSGVAAAIFYSLCSSEISTCDDNSFDFCGDCWLSDRNSSFEAQGRLLSNRNSCVRRNHKEHTQQFLFRR